MKRTLLILSSLFRSLDCRWVMRIAGPTLMLAGSAVSAVASVLWGG